ncbi:right-handed parallel beta-helix repeat-containing protein [bacterium]|nr:right-handed parallel beta-helix repeat-containing protein [bacterium]
MNARLLAVFVIVSICSLALGAPFDSGPKEFTQPGGTKFFGRYYGDEFESFLRTSDGYTFVGRTPDGSEGPYEYAAIGGDGNFVGSGKYVGIDPAPAEAYMLDRCCAAKDAILVRMTEFYNWLDGSGDLDNWRDSTLMACAANDTLVINVGLLLIDFPDRLHVESCIDTVGTPDPCLIYAGQKPRHINNMMNSIGTYHGYQPGHAIWHGNHNPNLHPTWQQRVYGSFREYWREVSYSLWDVRSTIINANDGLDWADWITTDSSQWCYTPQSLANHVKQKARDRGWSVDNYHQIIIFYPGDIRGALYNGHDQLFYMLAFSSDPECVLVPLGGPDTQMGWRFAHIGTMAHEWGHLIGWTDFRAAGLASLMAQGNGLGPSGNGEARPCRLGALLEHQIGWLECMSQDQIGGIVELTSSQHVDMPVPTENSHTVCSFGNFLLEGRHIRKNLPYEEPIRGQYWQGVDDFMFQGELPVGTNQAQMVIWDTTCSTYYWDNFHCNSVVRNSSSLTYMWRADPAGGDFQWWAWPGEFAHSPNTLNWTPFTFPNTGTTGSAILNILPNDADSTLGFDFVLNSPQNGPLTITQPVYAYKEYQFTDDVIIAAGGELWAQAPYQGTMSTLKFGAGKNLIVSPGGFIKARGASGTNRALFQGINTDPPNAWGGIVFNGTDWQNQLELCRVSDADTGITVGVNASASVVNCEINAHYAGVKTLTTSSTINLAGDSLTTPSYAIYSPAGTINFSGRNSIKGIYLGGGLLSFAPGSDIRIKPDSYIHCYGSFDASGTAAQPIIFQRSGATAWAGIRIEDHGTNNHMSYATVKGARHGIIVSNSSRAMLDHITVQDCESGVVYTWYSSGSLTNSTIRNNSKRGVFLLHNNASLNNNAVYNNGWYGLRMWGCNYSSIMYNTVHDNGILHDPNDAYWTGIQLLEGAAHLTCNDVYENEGPGMLVLPQGFGYMGNGGGHNDFRDNNQAISIGRPDLGQLCLLSGRADINCGMNTFEDAEDQHVLIYEMPLPIPDNRRFEFSYWGTTDIGNILDRIPGDPDILPILEVDATCPPDPNIPVECMEEEEHSVFLEGWEHEMAAQFNTAVERYENYLNLYPGGKYEALTIDRLLFCKKAQDWSWSDTRNYFLQMAQDSSKDSSFVALCKANAAWCLIEMDDWYGGYEELVALIDTSLKEYAYLSVSLKTLLAELKADESEILSIPGDGNGRSDGSSIDETAATFEAKLADVDNKLSALLAQYRPPDGPPQTQQVPVIPTTFALYQNYPNPFNPVTEIRFDLPEKAAVELRVFNTLGQLVATIVEETRNAGFYEVQWDASGFSSGMYVCQLRAGNFVDSKKMLLLR